MGRHKFRLSDMLPNAWFFKLRDMRAARATGAASPGGAASRACRPTPSTPRRTSYYYSPRAGDPVGSSPLHPRASDTQFPPLPLSPPRRSSSAKRRHRRRAVKLAPSVSGSSVLSSPVSTGCRCRRKPELVPVQAPGTPPCRRDRFVGYNDDDSPDSAETLKKTVDELRLNGKVITSATDIIIDLRTKNKRPDNTKTHLPPIITKPKRTTPNGCDLEDKHIDVLAHATQRSTPFSDEQQSKVVAKPRRSASSPSARRLKTRGNTPRVASSKKPKPPAPAPSPARTKPPPPPLAESFAVVKTSRDPRRDFRESMEEMIAENAICTAADLEDLLACYLSLNAAEYHDLIVDVFEHIWARLAGIDM